MGSILSPLNPFYGANAEELTNQLNAIDTWVETVKTPSAQAEIDSYRQWRQGLGWYATSIDLDETLKEAKKRRGDIQVASGDTDLVAAGFHPADLPSETGTATLQPLLDESSHDSSAIRVLQRALRIHETGSFDNATKLAVIAFQTSHKIKPNNGMVGPLTWSALGIKDLPVAKTELDKPAIPIWTYVAAGAVGVVVLKKLI